MFKAHRLVYHSTLGSRVKKKKKSHTREGEQSGVVYIKRIAPDGPASREGTLQVTSPNRPYS